MPEQMVSSDAYGQLETAGVASSLPNEPACRVQLNDLLVRVRLSART